MNKCRQCGLQLSDELINIHGVMVDECFYCWQSNRAGKLREQVGSIQGEHTTPENLGGRARESRDKSSSAF